MVDNGGTEGRGKWISTASGEKRVEKRGEKKSVKFIKSFKTKRGIYGGV